MQLEHGLNDRVPVEVRDLSFGPLIESTSNDLKEGLELFWLVSQVLSELVSLRAGHGEDESGKGQAVSKTQRSKAPHSSLLMTL